MFERAVEGLLPTTRAVREAVLAARRSGPVASVEDAAALAVLAEQVQALALLSLAECSASGQLDVAGAPTAGKVLADALGISRGHANARVRLADAMRGVLSPLADDALDGLLTVEHVDAVRRGLRGLPARDDVPELVEAARAVARATTPTRAFREVRARVTALQPVLDEGAELDDRLGISIDVLPDGSGLWSGRTTPEQTALCVGLLDSAVRSQLAREEAASTGRAGDELALRGEIRDAFDGSALDAAQLSGLRPKRSHRLRRADALLELLRHAAACGAAPSGSAAALTVVVDATALAVAAAEPAGLGFGPRSRVRCSLPTGGRVDGRALLRLACDADVSVAVRSLDGTGRERLDLGRSARSATPAQRRALAARWGGCAGAHCDAPMSRTEVHHVRPWSLDGDTDLDELVPFCSVEHHDVHDRDGVVVLKDGRTVTATGWGPPADQLPAPPWARRARLPAA